MTLQADQWVECFDFRVGIMDIDQQGEVWGNIVLGPMQSQQISANRDTYNCYADPKTGSLLPLPKLNVLHGDDDRINKASTVNPSVTSFIADALIIQAPLHVEWPVSNFGNDLSQGGLFVIEQAGVGPTTTNSYNWTTRGRWYMGAMMFGEPVQYVDFALQKATVTTDWYLHNNPPFSSMTFGRTSTTTASCTPGDLRPVLAFHTTTKPWTDTTGTIASPWNSSDISQYATDIATTYGPNIGMFPDPNNMSVASVTQTALNGSVSDRGFLLSHQGRLIYVDNAVKTQWGNSSVYMLTDAVHYTSPMKWMEFGGTIIPDESNPSGYGTGVSFNANSLLLIRHGGGAVSIRGSLDNPQVVRLPAVEGTDGWSVRGAMTPLGFVYMNKSGVWAYQDNTDASKLLSIQWSSRNTYGMFGAEFANSFYGRGAIGWMAPWVFVPGNWVYDIRTQSWWRMKVTSELDDETLAERGFTAAYCLKSSLKNHLSEKDQMIFIPASRTGTVYKYRYMQYEQPTNRWQYVSNTLVGPARDILYQPIEVEVRIATSSWATDDQIVEFTIIGTDEQGIWREDTVIFTADINTIDNNDSYTMPIQLKASFAAQYRYATMAVKMKVYDMDESGGAPSLLGFRFSYQQHSQIPGTPFTTSTTSNSAV